MTVYNTYRLVADEGKLVTNGIIKGKVLDLKNKKLNSQKVNIKN